MWQCPLVDWDLSQQKRHWEKIDSFLESRRTLPYLCHASKEELACSITSVNWFSRWCDGFSKISFLGNASRKIPRLHEITKLENQLQGWSLLKNSRSSSHNSVDQRSWDSKVNWYHRDRLWRETDFPDRDMLDAMIASASKKILDRHLHFRRRVSVEEQRAQKFDRFLRWRQISSVIYEHFRATTAYEAVLGLSDSVQYYVCRTTISWFSMHNGTKLYCQQAKHLQKWSWKDCTSQNFMVLFRLRLYWPCMTRRLSETMGNHVIKGWRHLWGYMLIRRWELETSEPAMTLWKETQLPRADKERKPVLRGKWENAFIGRHMDNVLKETYVVSDMILYLETDTRLREEKDNILLLRPIQRQRLTGKNLEKIKQQRSAPLEGKGRFPCQNKSCEASSSNYWHPSVCQKCKSETGRICCKKCRFRHVEAEEEPS